MVNTIYDELRGTMNKNRWMKFKQKLRRIGLSQFDNWPDNEEKVRKIL